MKNTSVIETLAILAEIYRSNSNALLVSSLSSDGNTEETYVKLVTKVLQLSE